MSLLHWWPLNGNTNDLGLNPISLTNNGATVNSAGKIGSCYNFTTTQYMRATGLEFSSLTNCSVCFWFKISSSDGNWLPFTGQSGSYYILATSNGTGNFYHDHAGSNTKTIYCDGVVRANPNNDGNWHHYCITGIDLSSWTMFNINWYGSNASDNTWNWNGSINDVRIYDHVLTQKEVKEISKGLVLHYNFEDEEVEQTTNLSNYGNIGGWNNSGAASYNQNDTSIADIPCPNSKVLSITQTTAGQSAGTFGTTVSNLPSKTLTASVWFYMSGDHSGTTNVGPYIRSSKTDGSVGSLAYNGSTSWRSWPNNQWIRLTTTWTSNSEATTFYFCAYTANLNEKFAFNGWQIEEKDHATPYVNGTRRPNLVSTVVAGGRTTKDSTYAIHTNGEDSDTYFYLEFNKQMTVGKKYVMCCNVSGFDNASDYWSFPICAQSYSDNAIVLKNGFCSTIFEWRESQWTTNNNTRTILDDNGNTSGVRAKNISITNIAVYDYPDVYDNSGYGNNGNIFGNLQISSDSISGQYAAVFNGSDTAIQTPNLASLIHDGIYTINLWFNVPSLGSKSWGTFYGGPSGYEFSSRRNSTPTVVAYSWGQNSSGGYEYNLNTWYMLTVVRTTSDSKWYINGELYYTGSAGSIPSGNYFIGAWRDAASQNYKGKIADFKIYSTALSADDIKAEYNRKAAIDKNGNLFTGEIIESNLINIIDTARWGIAVKAWNNCLGRSGQANNTQTFTNSGLRIYRTPNHDGLAQSGHGWDNWGGIKFTPILEDSNALQKGHTYLIKYHVVGKTCDTLNQGWDNQMGWGGGGLSPSPSNVTKSGVSGGFNGEKDCWYKFTINDEVYKTCTSSYSSFVQGTVYPSYRDFVIYCNYSVTNEDGTDLYITNPRMYDITGLTEQEIQVLKTGILLCEDIYECPDINVRFEKSKTVSVVSVEEL